MSYLDLYETIRDLEYLPGWRFELRTGNTWNVSSLAEVSVLPVTTASGAVAITGQRALLFITLSTPDSEYGTSGPAVMITHSFAAPHWGWTGDWAQWVLECIFRVHHHEAMEFFKIAGHKVFYPEHGPGADPYRVRRKVEIR